MPDFYIRHSFNCNYFNLIIRLFHNMSIKGCMQLRLNCFFSVITTGKSSFSFQHTGCRRFIDDISCWFTIFRKYKRITIYSPYKMTKGMVKNQIRTFIVISYFINIAVKITCIGLQFLLPFRQYFFNDTI